MIMNVHGNRVDLLGETTAAGRYAAGASIFPNHCCARSWGGSRMVVREPVKPLVAKGLIDTASKAGMRVLSADRANEASIAETKKAYPACPAPVKAF